MHTPPGLGLRSYSFYYITVFTFTWKLSLKYFEALELKILGNKYFFITTNIKIIMKLPDSKVQKETLRFS